MLAALGLLAVGAVVLYLGAEAAVRGSVALTRSLGVSAFALGAILFGIDVEGLGTALVAAGRGQTALAAGEIFGTVLFLYTAAFGVALLVSREPIPSPDPIMVLAPALPLTVAAAALTDRFVGRLEGGLLVALYGGYVLVVLREERLARARGERLERDAAEGPSWAGRSAVLAIGGLGLLYGGAALLVAGGTTLLQRTDLSAGFVGAAVVGALVSLDEVFLEVLPVRRGAPELATGNLFGTVAAFTSGVLGLAALVRPLVLDAAAAIGYLGAASVYAVVATVFLARGRAWRGLGVTVIALYVAWLLWSAGV